MLVALLLVGIMARSNLIAIAACVLLILRFSNLSFVFPILERRGLEVGLLFLLLYILVPIAQGMIFEKDLIYNITSVSYTLHYRGAVVTSFFKASMAPDMEALNFIYLDCLVQ